MLEEAIRALEEKERAIQRMLELERLVVVETGRAISLFTSFDRAGEAHVSKAEELLKELKAFPYRQETKLAVEGEVVEAKVVGKELLGIGYSISHHSPEAQLYGVLDAIGELKRALLKALLQDDVGKARVILKSMESLFAEVEGVVFTNATLPNFRRKRDAARYALESAMELLARRL